MPEANINFGAYERTGNPTLAAVNVYAETYPSASGLRIQMRARPGLETFADVGTGPSRAAHAKDGVFSGAALLLSGTALSTLTAGGVETILTGAIPGDDLVDIDSGQDADLNDLARIATGSALYKAQAGLVVLEDFPEAGGSGAASVCYHRGYWIATEVGTDQVFVLIPGDDEWLPLSFISAEYAPDKVLAVRSRGDQIALVGSSTTEIWALNSESADPPLVPYGGMNFDFGTRHRATVVNCTGSLMMVDNNCIVRRWDGGQFEPVSGPGLAAIIRRAGASDLRSWTFNVEGHRFYVLTIGSVATWVYDLDGAGEKWTTFESLGFDYWRAHLGCTLGSGDATIACDNTTSRVWRLDATRRTDEDEVFAKVFCATVEGQDKPIPCANAVVLCDVGDGPLSGQGSAPLIGERHSDNQGKVFSAWQFEPMPATGEYDTLPRFNALGTIPAFMGRIFQFRVSDPGSSVFKRVFLNV